jgi:hypothetical protein
MARFNIERIGEFYGATEGNANISECIIKQLLSHKSF